MCNRVLLLFEKLPQWNLHVNCHTNGTKFQSGVRFQTGLSSLRVSCKRALSNQSVIFNPWKLPNWIAFYQNSFVMYHLVCYITWLDAAMDDLQTRPLRQILLYGLKITNWNVSSAFKLTFGRNRFGKRTVYNLHTRIHF